MHSISYPTNKGSGMLRIHSQDVYGSSVILYVGNNKSEDIIIATGIFMYRNIILQTFKPFYKGCINTK